MERRSSGALVVWAGILAAASAGCHSGANTPAVGSATRQSVTSVRAFGDSALLSTTHLVSFDAAREHVQISTRNTKTLIVLAVVPGREIEVFVPGDYVVQRQREQYEFAIDMRRPSDAINPQDAAAAAQVKQEYDRCVKQAAVAAERAAQQRARAVRRDSTGKIISGSTAPAVIVDTHTCDRMSEIRPVKRTPTFLPARAPADRYLVVLTSTSQISRTQLYERLATLTAVAPDVATTIEAIAAGLYVGVKGTWGGLFVAW